MILELGLGYVSKYLPSSGSTFKVYLLTRPVLLELGPNLIATWLTKVVCRYTVNVRLSARGDSLGYSLVTSWTDWSMGIRSLFLAGRAYSFDGVPRQRSLGGRSPGSTLGLSSATSSFSGVYERLEEPNHVLHSPDSLTDGRANVFSKAFRDARTRPRSRASSYTLAWAGRPVQLVGRKSGLTSTINQQRHGARTLFDFQVA